MRRSPSRPRLGPGRVLTHELPGFFSLGIILSSSRDAHGADVPPVLAAHRTARHDLPHSAHVLQSRPPPIRPTVLRGSVLRSLLRRVLRVSARLSRIVLSSSHLARSPQPPMLLLAAGCSVGGRERKMLAACRHPSFQSLLSLSVTSFTHVSDASSEHVISLRQFPLGLSGGISFLVYLYPLNACECSLPAIPIDRNVTVRGDAKVHCGTEMHVVCADG